MKGHLENEKISWLAFFSAAITYVIVCMTKNTYASAIAAIVQEGMLTKADAGVINASFYLFYGCTQLFGGSLSDRFSPFTILTISLVGNLACNVAMALSGSFTALLIVWSINGLAQFGVWPAVVKIIASVIMPAHRQKSMFYISFTFSAGAFLSYLTAMIVLKFGTWQHLFWTSAVALLFVGIFLVISTKRIRANMVPDTPDMVKSPKEKELSQQKTPLVKLLFASGLIFIFVPALVRCMLDIGVKSWVPTMIMESYSNVSPSFASMLTSLLFVLNLTAVFFVNWLYPRRCQNIAGAIGIFFIISLPFLMLIVLTGKVHLMLITAAMALVTTFMTSASQLLNVILPAAFAKQGRTGTIAGILNAFGAFGCMLGSFVYGYTAEYFGWTTTAFLWVMLAVITIMFCLIALPLWNRFTENE